MSGFRWTPEAVAVFERRREEWARSGKVRPLAAHICKDEPEPGFTQQGKPSKPAQKEKTPPALKPRKVSPLEALLSQQLMALKVPAPYVEFVGAVPNRQFRIDFAWPSVKVAVEVQGMVHRIMERFLADTEKHCLLVLNGWKVLPVSGDDIRSGRAAGWILSLLSQAGDTQ